MWLLKEALGAEHILNLSYGGNSPSGVNRTLDWYLRNPGYYLSLKKKDMTARLGNKIK